MQAIALSTLVFLVLAVVSTTLLIGWLAGHYWPALRQAHCSFLFALRGLLPLPETLRPGLPAHCTELQAQFIVVEAAEPERAAQQLAIATTACWEMSGKVKLARDKFCYEVVFKGLKKELSFEHLKNHLPPAVEAEWKVDSIKARTSVAVYYNATLGKVVIE